MGVLEDMVIGLGKTPTAEEELLGLGRLAYEGYVGGFNEVEELAGRRRVDFPKWETMKKPAQLVWVRAAMNVQKPARLAAIRELRVEYTAELAKVQKAATEFFKEAIIAGKTVEEAAIEAAAKVQAKLEVAAMEERERAADG